jgi:hypothetical protein
MLYFLHLKTQAKGLMPQVNSSRYHFAWASLARDYLSIMSSSVLSECAFSQGGIMITKRRTSEKKFEFFFLSLQTGQFCSRQLNSVEPIGPIYS